MQVTVTLEDALYQEALSLADPGTNAADLVQEALRTFVRVQAARRLAALGGQAGQMQDISRRANDASRSAAQG
ncbi:type II toxin-antitoxin system VapB family antitoxin [Pulveribacter sp.]|uniref:type II toxin-antitoxin system VapB family antitoxin n=1 Tax=Pulveribacter sp. TaxID=2678893 RepID=UPI0028AD4AB2|nr:type II toxin-antitoxin system VapB family antitoxin [Pulveribacter sp.]